MKRIYKNLISLALIAIFLFSCSKNNKFTKDEFGNMIYRDKDGNILKDTWIDYNGDRYHVDLNGFLEKEKWIEHEYYVGPEGKLMENYWLDDKDGNTYYLDNNGKYVHDNIVNIDGKDYGFDSYGLRVHNAVAIAENTAYYFNENYEKDTAYGWKTDGANYYFVKEDGTAVVNDWVTVGDKTYHFDEKGVMQTTAVIDDKYYVGEDGAMLVNTEMKFGDDTYVFDENGVFTLKVEPKYYKKNVVYKLYYSSSGNCITYDTDLCIKNGTLQYVDFCNNQSLFFCLVKSSDAALCFNISNSSFSVNSSMLDVVHYGVVKCDNGISINVTYKIKKVSGYTVYMEPVDETAYNKLINILNGNRDVSFNITFDDWTYQDKAVTISAEINPGNFSEVYDSVRYKTYW